MHHLPGIELGVATHTGRVRSSNEDDYLVVAPQTPAQAAGRGLLLFVADGMGGVTGGAEASRTAVRAAVQPFLRAAGQQGEAGFAAAEVMAEAFAHAATEVAEAAQQEPHLKEMGTTLTAVHLRGHALCLGHVGDTRCLLLRDGRLEQLSEDHAVTEPEAFLTRCIGAGQLRTQADVAEFELRDGDVLVLCSDGLWGTVPAGEIRRVVQTLGTQASAEELVRLANRAGGPDNITVLVLRLRGGGASGEDLQTVDLPSEELRQPALLRRPAASLRPSRWPWLLLPLALALLGFGLRRFL